MSENQYDKLCGLSREWRRKAEDLDFLGEVALSQSEAESLLSLLGIFHRRVSEPELSFALAVAAVNWAYWRGVDEENAKSFRDSFMVHAIGHTDHRGWDVLWGPAIERSICDWCGEPPRSGTYRYVGLILRHAGVPKSKIQALAEMLENLDSGIGWNELPLERDAVVRSYISPGFGRCISDFLSSDSGTTYIRNLCADLALIRSRRGKASTDLPGYRPGLISELLEIIGSVDVGGPMTATLPTPYVRLEPTTGSLQLILDERLVRRKPQAECDQWGRRLFDTRIDIGPGELEPTASYTGRMPDGRRWSTNGWGYSDTGAWAVFHQDGRLVSTHAHGDDVAVGAYFLAVTGKLNVAGLWPEAGDQGERFLPDGTEFRLWTVQIGESDSGKLPGLKTSANTRPWIECSNGGPLTRLTSMDAVCPDAPEILVYGWTARNRRRFQLLVTVEGRTEEAICGEPDENNVSVFKVQNVAIGSVAEVELIPVGYQHGPRVSQTLNIVRFPGELFFDEVLYPEHREARIRMRVSTGLKLVAHGDCRIESNEKFSTLIAPAHVRSVECHVERGASSLGVRFPIRRAGFSFSDTPSEPAIFDRALIHQLRQSKHIASTFVISGAPGAVVDLCSKDRYGTVRCWRSGLRLGSNGRLDWPLTEIVDVIRSETGVLRILLKFSGQEVDTGAVFFEPQDEDLETRDLPTAATEYLQVLSSPLRSGQTPQSLEPDWLYQRTSLIAKIDYALQLSPVDPRRPGNFDWVEKLREILRERSRLDHTSANSWRDQVVSHFESINLPRRPPRWKAAIDAMLAEVENRVDLRGPLHRLLSGIVDPKLPEGLVNGWRSYLQFLEQDASAEARLRRANDYFATATRGDMPWSAIAERLSVWTLLRAGAIATFLERQEILRPLAACDEFDAQIRAVANLLTLGPNSADCISSGGLFASARADDQAIALALSGASGSWYSAAEQSWLGAWLGWRQAVMMGFPDVDRERLRRLTLEQISRIPARMEGVVTEELETGTPKCWEFARTR